MNKVILMGRLTRDPEVQTTQGGTVVARYTLAVDRRIKKEGEQEADFIVCTCFGKAAEFAEKYFKKGTKIIVTGRIVTGSYTNKDGQKVYTTSIIAEDQEFAESKTASQGEGAQNSTAPAAGQATDPSGFMNIPDGIDEDLPFN